MSTQNKIDIHLVGNVTIDEVYSVDRWPSEGTSNKFNSYRRTVGGLGNILSVLNTQKYKTLIQAVVGKDDEGQFIKNYIENKGATPSLTYNLDHSTTKALILSNTGSSERTSFVDWGCGKDRIIISPMRSKWTHISYLDISCIPEIGILKDFSDVISADLCLSNPSDIDKNKVFKSLEYLDYLFISNSEYLGYTEKGEDLLSFGVKQVILHNIGHTNLEGKIKDTVKNSIKPAHNLDVLGAGDIYCAKVIENLLKSKSLINSVEDAHVKTSEILINRKLR